MRILRVLIVAGAVLALATPVVGAPASTGDFVSGSGYRMDPATGTQRRVQFNVYAESGSNSTWGSYWFDQLPVVGTATFSGLVTCMDRVGSKAAVGGFITRPATGYRVGDRFLLFISDNSDQDPTHPDVISQTYILPYQANEVTVPPFFPYRCPDAGTTAHDAFNVQGDVAIGNVSP